MLLREFFHEQGAFSPINGGIEDNGYGDDPRYEPKDDESTLEKSSTRKTRLTLRQINRLRRMKEVRHFEKIKDLKTVRKMYATPPEEGGGMGDLGF